MCTKRSLFGITALLVFLVSCNTDNTFSKKRFLSECQFSIENNLLSDREEYDAILLYEQRRPHETDSLYKLFNRTHDYDLNLRICRSFGKGGFLRPWGRGKDSLLIDNFFARAINRSDTKQELIELILTYLWDKSYQCQKIISEVCLRPEYYVNDSLKYVALTYAVDSNYETDVDMETILKLSRERMSYAAKVFGSNSDQAYNALFECAQLTQFDDGKEKDVVDSLFRYHQTHDRKYKNGTSVTDLNSDPIYIRYTSCYEDDEFEYAGQLLGFLNANVALNEETGNYLYNSEARIALLYETASFMYYFGKDIPEYEDEYITWLDKALDMSVSYLSPEGDNVDILQFLQPDHLFYSPIIDMMESAYNTPSAEKAYDLALFLKGTSALLTRDLIRAIKDQGNKELLDYVDSLRQYYRGDPFADMNPIDVIENVITSPWSKREQYFRNLLITSTSKIDPKELWKSCSMKTADVIKALRPGESAVEIIKTLPFVGDGEIYEALILNYGQAVPIRVKICDGKSLKELLIKGNLYDNKSGAVYDSIAKPFMSLVTGNTVFIAPDGLFSLINFSAINKGDDSLISDKWNIVQCISTKTVCENKIDDIPSFTSIALFGGLEYEPGIHDLHYSNSNTVTRDIERDGFGYLPNTLEEVNTINGIASHYNINCSLYTGINGTESELRALTGKNVSIIHVATHGFYYNTEELSMNRVSLLSGKRKEALYRCGLIFSNGQDAWLNGIDSYDTSNGILLGSEIANLDLIDTELVVLAACNTGLGDISSEGVTGLQMAFKRAGVKSLLMTLSKVDDEATSFFMTNFYEHLFSGEDKHSAYKAAINTMRNSEKYSDPKYWSSFILVD